MVYADRFTPEDEKRRVRETSEEAGSIPFLVNERSKLTRLQHLILTRLSDGKAPMRAALI